MNLSAESRRLVLLGPQPNYESLREAIAHLGIRHSVALISAGWELDESQDGQIRDALAPQVINLELFKRSEELFHLDGELIHQLRIRQDQLRRLRDVYRMRIESGLQVARNLLKTVAADSGSEQGDSPDLDLRPELQSAIEAVTAIDAEYLRRTSAICSQFEARLQTWERPRVRKHREEIASHLNKCEAVLISGGNVGIILNRLRIFGVLELCPQLPIIAWSGGAMALSSQIVFFHDSPPQGKGDPEIFRAGMGMLNGLIPFPNAEERLDLDNASRVALLANRFADQTCVAFNESAMVECQNGNWTANASARVLSPSGDLVRFQDA